MLLHNQVAPGTKVPYIDHHDVSVHKPHIILLSNAVTAGLLHNKCLALKNITKHIHLNIHTTKHLKLSYFAKILSLPLFTSHFSRHDS